MATTRELGIDKNTLRRKIIRLGIINKSWQYRSKILSCFEHILINTDIVDSLIRWFVDSLIRWFVKWL
jgi:hypothetical protein